MSGRAVVSSRSPRGSGERRPTDRRRASGSTPSRPHPSPRASPSAGPPSPTSPEGPSAPPELAEVARAVQRLAPRAFWFSIPGAGLLVFLRAEGSGVLQVGDVAGGVAEECERWGVPVRRVSSGAEAEAALVAWEMVYPPTGKPLDFDAALPRRHNRPRGLQHWQSDFLGALKRLKDVRAACKEVRVSRSWVYELRRRDASFRSLWEAALAG